MALQRQLVGPETRPQDASLLEQRSRGHQAYSDLVEEIVREAVRRLERLPTSDYVLRDEMEQFKKDLMPRLDDIRDVLGLVLAQTSFSSSSFAQLAVLLSNQQQQQENRRNAKLRAYLGAILAGTSTPPLPSGTAIDDTKELMAFNRELAAFHRLLPDLLKESEGLYVAIRDGAVVDRDASDVDLAERVCVRYPNDYVLVRKVQRAEPPDVVIPSPQVVGT